MMNNLNTWQWNLETLNWTQYWFIPMALAMLLCYLVMSSMKAKKKKPVVEKPFNLTWANELYAMSFSGLYAQVVNPNSKDKRVQQTERQIVEAGMSHCLNYRVFMVVRVLFFFVLTALALFVVLFFPATLSLIHFLFNIDFSTLDSNVQNNVMGAMMLALFALNLAPTMWLKRRANRRQYEFVYNLPILQFFTIQMLRSNSVVRQVLYLLSRVETSYKDLFTVGYRIYSRDIKGGFAYLEACFKHTKYKETVNVLQDYSDYSREETLRVLEQISYDVAEESKAIQKSKNITGNILSQVSLVIPFASVLILGFVPVIVYGLMGMSQQI